jgi:hypothetical protein
MSRVIPVAALACGAIGAMILPPVGLSAPAADEPRFITPEELDKLPVGITVTHEPKAALATLTGKSERRAKYTWWVQDDRRREGRGGDHR